MIESAVDFLKTVDVKVLQAQQSELYSATGRNDSAFADGYALGLQTARTMLLGSAALAIKGVNPEDVL